MFKLKKIMLMLFILLTLFTTFAFSVKAVSLIPVPDYRTTNGSIKYRNTNITVMMPSEYLRKDIGFRAVWVTPVTNDYDAYFKNEQQFKQEMVRILETLEYYHMNAIIFHIRTFHDAMYNSKINQISKYYASVNFDEFDPLKWLIDECHKRGIEFHAWLNPYRVGTYSDLKALAASYPKTNVASNVDNLLVGSNNDVILDPGRPEVRSFLIETVKEIIENYDVDAIHFDDYFYISGANDAKTRELYNTENLSIGDFRRKQVDLLIEGIHNLLNDYYKKTKKYIQFGISPSGMYRNFGSYVSPDKYQYDSKGRLTYPLGSNTAGFAHYDNYLYSDTLKWAYEGWIDYLVPQVYFAFDHDRAPFADIVEWWSMALKYSKCNLYIGTALYLAGNGSAFGWGSNPNEMVYQLQFASQFPEVQGQVIFSYKQLASSLRKGQHYYENMNRVKKQMWSKDVILPEVRNAKTKVKLNSVSNLEVTKTSKGYLISFDAIAGAKNYAIYRSINSLTFSEEELIKVVGSANKDGKISFLDESSTNTNYYYGVIPLSTTNSKGDASTVSTKDAKQSDLIPVFNLPKVFYDEVTTKDNTITISWEKEYAYYGNDYEYEVYISTDGVNFTKNPFKVYYEKYYYYTYLNIGSFNKYYFYMNVKNDLCNDKTKIYEVKIKDDLGGVNGFGVKNKAIAGSKLELIWHTLPLENVNFKVQYSKNKIVWNDLNGTIKKDATFVTFTTDLPNTYSNYYYRVIAENSTGISISKVIQVEAYSELPALKVTANGTLVTTPLYVNQGSTLRILWDNLDNNILYNISISTDLVTFEHFKNFNNLNKFVYLDEQTGIDLYAPVGYHTLFVKIYAEVIDRAKSDEVIIEVRIIPTNPSTKDTIKNIYSYYTAKIKESGIFK